MLAHTDHLSDSWFKTEILGGLNGANIKFIDPSANDGQYGMLQWICGHRQDLSFWTSQTPLSPLELNRSPDYL
jgi:hypothetical protein